MKIIHFGWLVSFSALGSFACSSSSDAAASGGDDTANTHQDAGASSGNKSDAGVSHDAGAAKDAGIPDASVVQLSPFTFVIGGQTRTLTKMNLHTASEYCAHEISMEANLAPMGDEIDDPGDPPQLQLTICMDDLPASNVVQYGETSLDPTVAQLQFEFETSGSGHFPIAEGPGIHVVQDGSKGTFAMTASGTFDLSDGTGGTPFTLELQQPVN